MKKRICSAFLTLVLVLSLAMCYPVRVVHADALGLEYSMEFAELLYTLMVNGMLAGGAVDAASMDYDSAMDLFSNFVDSMFKPYLLDEVGPIYLPDDCIITYNSDGFVVRDAIKSITDGTGALQLPTKEAWKNFRVVQGGGSGSPGGDPNDDGHFSLIERIKIGTDFFGFMSAWVYNLWTGGAEGLNPNDYLLSFGELPNLLQGLDQYRWRGYYQDNPLNSNTYLVKGFIACREDDGYIVYVLDTAQFDYYKTAFLIDENNGYIYFYEKYIDSSYSRTSKFQLHVYKYFIDGSVVDFGTVSNTQVVYGDGSLFSLNIPVFNDYDLMQDFLFGLSNAGIMNGYAYDFPGLAKSIAEALAPLADIQVAPDVLSDVAEALAEAAAALPEPAPDNDPAANNDDYKEAVQEAVKNTVPEVAPDPDPDPEPAPLPGEITGIEGVERFKVDLTMVFPFCLPFDLVRLLEALSADPVAPSFTIPFVVPALGIEETVTLDLSIFDEVAAIFRTGELISFVIVLIFVTRKVIKW